MVVQADMTQEQRTLLLAIACAHSAFLDLQPGVEADDFDEFTKRLVTLARPLDPFTSAEDGLQGIKTQLETRLPEVRYSFVHGKRLCSFFLALQSSFAPLHDDTFELPERVSSSEPRQKNLIANLVVMLNADLREALHGIGNSVPTTSSSPPSVDPTGRPTTSASQA